MVLTVALCEQEKDTGHVNVTDGYLLTGEFMNHLRNILQGISNVFTSFQPRSYAHPRGFKDDAENLSRDAKNLGRYFTKSADTVYGKAISGAKKKR
ncbi:hypothetical protein JFQ93_001531 [Aeromonas sobria]|jgi:hypothetical protein|nr:hypothetical protein [Aeromonas sobria]